MRAPRPVVGVRPPWQGLRAPNAGGTLPAMELLRFLDGALAGGPPLRLGHVGRPIPGRHALLERMAWLFGQRGIRRDHGRRGACGSGHLWGGLGGRGGWHLRRRLLHADAGRSGAPSGGRRRVSGGRSRDTFRCAPRDDRQQCRRRAGGLRGCWSRWPGVRRMPGRSQSGDGRHDGDCDAAAGTGTAEGWRHRRSRSTALRSSTQCREIPNIYRSSDA